MITKKYNNKIDILETTLTGEISVNDLIKYIESLEKDDSLPRKLVILTDSRKARFSKDVNPEDVIKLVEANNKSLAKRDYIIDGFIVDGSLETALGQLYQELSKTDNYKFNLFHTREAALEWVLAIKESLQ